MEPTTKEENDYVLSGNELIAKFMGYTVYHKRYPRNHGIGAPEIVDNMECIREKLKYHKDWNRLMEVWIKIRELDIIDDKGQFHHSWHKQNISTQISYGTIETSYTAIINFIKWYNSTKQ